MRTFLEQLMRCSVSSGKERLANPGERTTTAAMAIGSKVLVDTNVQLTCLNASSSMVFMSSKKTAIVTRASQGIGAALVEALLKAGYNVVRLWAAESGAAEDDRLGLAVIENRRLTEQTSEF